MTRLSPLESLQKAVTIYGSQSAAARARGVSQAAVWKWVHGKTELPGEHVLAIEADTGISKHDLRPDLYPRAAVEAEDAVAESVVPAR